MSLNNLILSRHWTVCFTGSVYQDTKISSFMEAWLTQSGYPVISVTKLRDRKYRLRQERFVNKPNYSNRKITQKKWPVSTVGLFTSYDVQ